MPLSGRGRNRESGGDARSITGHKTGESPIAFQTLVEQSLSLILVTDRTGKIEYVNPRFCAVTGFDESELADRLVQELGDVDSATRVDVDGRLSAGLPWRGAIETKKKNGETVTIFAEVSPVSDDAGNVTHFVSVGQDITAERETTRQLRASEEKFRRLAEALPAMTFIVQGARARFVSSHAEEILGYTVEELLAMHFWDPVHPDFKETVRELGLSLQNGEREPEPYEMKFVTKSGEERWGLAAVSRIEFEGSPAVVGCVFDITEARKTADALHERDLQLRLMTEQMPSVVWMTDRNLTVTHVAGAGLGRLGIDVSEFLGRTIPPRYPLESTDTTLFDAHQAALGGASSTYELKFLGIWFESRIEPLHGPNGEIIGCLGLSFDITARKHAEEALSESELKFRSLVDTMPAAAFIFQGTGYRYANRACYEVLGYEEKDLAHLNFWDVIHPDYRDLVRERGLARLRGEDVPTTYELRFLKKDGEPRWGLYSGAVIQYEGEPAILGIVSDITERKVAEQALAASEEKFRTLVDTMPAAAFIYQDNQLKYVNRTFVDMLGYTPEDFARFNWWEVIHPDYRDLARERSLARLRGEPVPATYEVRFLTKSGAAGWGLYSGALITYERAPAIMGTLYDITERKAAEQAVIDSEEKFRTLVDTIPAATFIYQGTRLKYVNRRFFDVLGYTPEDLSSLTWWDVLHPDYRDLVRERGLARLRGEPVPASYEVRFMTKSGESRWGIYAGALITYEGEPAVIGTVYDITERKTAEQAVIDSEEKFRTLVETMPAAVIIFQDNKVRYANHMTFDIFGYEPQDLTKVDFWDVVHPDHRALLRRRGDARLRGEDVPSSYEFPFLRKDGEPRWGLYFSATITYEGKPALIGSVYDITERKEAEETLARSEDRFRLLYDDNPSMYFTLSEDLRILSANRHGAEQLGYGASDLIGQPYFAVVHPDDQASIRRQLLSLVKRRGGEHDIEFRKVRKGGGVIWVQETVGVAQDVDGTDILLVVCEDITERRRMEEELQALRDDVERKAEQAIVNRVSPYNLSFRELTVLDLVTGGRSDKEIAVVLGIRPQTVSKHVANVLRKMTASSRTEAGVRALREGLIK